MEPEDINKIYSNDYADYLIHYSGDPAFLEPYSNDLTVVINFFFASVYVPVNQMTEDIISKIGYGALPNLFGLTSNASPDASGITRIRNIPNLNLRGNGVLIGIVDTGIDYTNPIFQYADGTTRVAAIWDQTIISDKTQEGIAYGTEYSSEQINEALKSENPFDIVPSKDEIGHGTMVAGIAAGNEDPENGFSGVAPNAEFVIVKLKLAKPYLKYFFRLPENAVAYQENDIVFGLQYLFDFAAKVNKPIVLCITLDTSQFAHNGRGFTGSWLSLQSGTPGVATVISVGNEGNARRHYAGVIEEEPGYDIVELNVGPGESGFSIELWGTSPNLFSIDITSPSGQYIPIIDIRSNQTLEITFIFESTIIQIDNQLLESQSAEQLILLRFNQPTEGIWKFKVYSIGIYPIDFNIWLPMSNFITNDTYFIRSSPYTTLLTLSCTLVPIAVTAYNTTDESLYINAGKGYTLNNLIKPDIASPGVNILSPAPGHGFVQATGTSAAAAHTAGVAAMLFEWGIIKRNYPNMSTQDMKIFMIRGAKRKAGVSYPNKEWGYGILDVFNIFDRIRISR